MGLETGNYINDLVVTNPLGSDPKNQGDDHLRLIKKAIKQSIAGFGGNVITTGVDSAGSTISDYVITASSSPVAYASRMVVTFTATHTNSGAATINIDSIGEVDLTDLNGNALTGNEILSGAEVMAVYDGTKFKLMTGVFTTTFELPDQSGSNGKVLRTNGTNASWGMPALFIDERTSNTILGTGDDGTYVKITSGTFTQTFEDAATLGDGWQIILHNEGTGDITLDPDVSETIDGLASYIMYPGEVRLIQCDGIELVTIVLNTFSRTFTASGDFIKPPGYRFFEGLLWGGGGSGAKDTSGGAGGGGGACHRFIIDSSSISATQAFTIGAGGAAVTTATTDGNAGGTSTIATVSAYGGAGGSSSLGTGGGGGGVMSAGGGTATQIGGAPSGGGSEASNEPLQSTYGGGRGGMPAAAPVYGSSSYYGGGGGGSDTGAGVGGASFYGGGGGGGFDTASNAGGASVFGGSGGASNGASSGVSGSTPAGGGGGTETGTQSGAGGNGQLTIWGVV